MIAAELRRAIQAAAGQPDQDPLLRPGPQPGSYISSLPLRLDPDTAAALPVRITKEPWIAKADLTSPGYLTVTVTHHALARLAVRIAQAGPACATSDALASRTVSSIPDPDLAAAPDWSSARAALAAHLTTRLAAAAGATVLPPPAPQNAAAPQAPQTPKPEASPVKIAIEYAGRDAIRFALARTSPGGAPSQPAAVARHLMSNPAYAVRYAHAAAAAVVRWAASLGSRPAGFQPRLLTAPPELALLDALSWLPERVAMAARRGRPGDFAGYLVELAARTIDTMSTTSFTTIPTITSERLWLADAARTGLAAGLALIGVGAPERM